MKTSTLKTLKLVIVMFLSTFAISAFAQYDVTITVTNSLASPISGASVTLQGLGTQITDGSGTVVYYSVPWGNYNCTITMAGFITIVDPALYVSYTGNYPKTLYTIGDTYQGGLVFYIDPNGLNGLVCTPDDLQQHDFGCYGSTISGADGIVVGTGKQNTQDILSSCSTGFTAADTCLGANMNGYTDWYLPSKDELDSIYENLKVPALETFMSASYWSSSEYDANNAWAKDFSTGAAYNTQKSTSFFVRAIRNFGPPTPANAGPDQLNVLTTSVTLAANTPLYGTGQWNILSGGIGSFANIGDPNTTFTGLMGRDYKLVWTISNDGSSSDTVRVTMGSHLIGELYQGGKVFYVDPSGESGLIAATTDQSAGIQWYNGSAVTTYATWTALNYGKANTDSIIKYQGTGSYAARLCYDLELNGYKDWYLPSHDELDSMSLHINEIGNTGLNTYWSSTEYDITSSWALSFDGPSWYYDSKGNTHYVRAIRSFITSGQAPTATTLPTTIIEQTAATLYGTANANELSTTVTFEYGTTTALGSSIAADQSPIISSVSDTVSVNLTGLSPYTTYYYCLKTVNASGTTYGDTLSFTTSTVVDIDGNTYTAVVIGSQEWMGENLKVTKYRNGDDIVNTTDGPSWSYLSSGARAYYNNDSATYVNPYGALYNWYATVDDRKLCPTGWHVPIDSEWNTLVAYLGGEPVAGGSLKEAGTTHWSSPNTDADNSSGFTGLPGGVRSPNDGSYLGNLYNGYWWSASKSSYSTSWFYKLNYNNASVTPTDTSKNTGASVRCVKGEAYQLSFVVTDGQYGINYTEINVDGIGVDTTNESGYVMFDVAPVGTYNYTITANGYEIATGSVTIANENVFKSLTLNYIPKSVYVSSSIGNDEIGEGTLGSPYFTIQHGIDMAENEDTVRVLSGNYSNSGNTNISIIDKTITVIATDGPGTAIIDGFNGVSNDNVFNVSCGQCTTYHKINIIGFRINNSNTAIQVGANSFDVKIAENRIVYSTNGISISNGNNVVIERNFIKRTNNPAISINGGDSLFIFKNTIDSAYYGISLGVGNYAKVVNNIITNPDFIGINLSDLSDPNVDYNNIWNWGAGSDSLSSLPAANNIFVNPLFVDPSSLDYSLQTGSPCIDAGDPDPKFNDPDGTRGDMGAFYYPQTFTVTFHITDESSNPINGATVDFGPFGQQATDVNGDAVFTNSTLGNFNYTVTMGNFYNYSSSIEVTGNQTEGVILNHINRVSFYVSNNLGYIDGAEVTFGIYGSKFTDAGGYVYFDSIPNEAHNYTVTKAGHLAETGMVVVSGADVDEYVTMTSIFNVTFNVTSDGSTPVASANVTFDIYGTVPTDGSGVALFDSIPNGNYNYAIAINGYLPYSGNINVADGDYNEPVILTPIFNVTFSVTDPALSPITGAEVTLDVYPMQTTDVAGTTVFDSIQNGTYSYSITKTGYIPVSTNLTVSGADVNEPVTLTPIFNVTFNVTGNALPIENAEINVTGYGIFYTDALGSVTITDVIPATSTYSVTVAGFQVYNSSINVTTSDLTENVTLSPLTYNVTFYVYDEYSNPLDGVTVGVESVDTLLTSSGFVTFTDVPDGTYNYKTSIVGFNDSIGTITVSGGDLTKFVYMTQLKYNVTFVITDGTNPLVGAEVTLDGVGFATTDASGEVVFNNVVNGNYTYSVYNTGFNTSSGGLTVADADWTENVTLTLLTYNVTFNVYDELINPIDGASVALVGIDTLLTSSGSATFPSITNGTYNYEVKYAGFNDSIGTVTVLDGNLIKDVYMTQLKYNVTFIVTDGTNPVVGADVTLDGVGTFTTDAAGQVIFPNIINGNYSYSVSSGGFDTSTGGFTVSDADWSENVTLTPTVASYTITFQVFDGAIALENATITIPLFSPMMTNPSGVAEFYSMIDGSYNYEITLLGYDTYSGTVTVSGANITETVFLQPTLYQLTFNVYEGATPLEGAEVYIDGYPIDTTDITGTATFTVPNGNYNYSIFKYAYNQVIGNVVVENANKTELIDLTKMQLEQYITLKQGWNIFSTYLIPNDQDMQILFANLIAAGKLIKIQDQEGNSLEYIDPSWVNGIGDITYQQGYQIKVTEDIPIFMISGTLSPESGSLPYLAGWNISGFPSNNSMNAKDILQQLIDEGSLDKVQSQTGAAMQNIVGFGWINNIGYLIPGEGYKIRVNTNTALNYGNTKSLYVWDEVEEYKGVFNPSWVGNGLNHMNIYLKGATLEGKKLSAGDEIGIFDGNVCVGIYTISGNEDKLYKLKATLDDPYTSAIDGFTPGHQLSMKVWVASKNEFADQVNLTPIQGYNLIFESSGTTVLNLDAKRKPTGVTPDANSITSITSMYPNPFTDKVTINFTISKPSRVKIEVFDLLGSRVAILTDKDYETNNYSIEWNRNSETKGRVAPGIYIVKMKAGDYTTSKRLIAE